MKIENAQIFLGSAHQYAQHHEVEESLVEGISKPGTTWSAENLKQGMIYQRKESFDHLELSAEAQLMQTAQYTNKIPESLQPLRDQSPQLGPESPVTVAMPTIEPQGIIAADEPVELTPEDDAKLQLVIAMIEIITGKKIEFTNISNFEQPSEAATNAKQEAIESTEAITGEYGFAYHYSETYSESEQTQFTAQGIIQTADGKEIAINLELNMSRDFVSHHSVDIRAGAAQLKDPLVINFSGTAAQLTDEKIAFDIDADGAEDQISFVGPNSGFLALDKNNDGKINDGSELFGALSGNGFSDLAQFDEDNNNFIDENDSIYNKLRIWTRDPEGNNQLIALGRANVGAIYLGYSSTPFEIKDVDNQLQGIVRASGIYVGDDGSVGTVQQLDLVV